MFGIDANKLFDKIKGEVLPEMPTQDVDELVKYGLALNYLIKMNTYKEIACLTGATVGSFCFFAISSPLWAAAGATGAIAGIIHYAKSAKESAMSDKFFKLLTLGLDMIHNATPEEVQKILNNITAEDLVDFLERKGVTSNAE